MSFWDWIRDRLVLKPQNTATAGELKILLDGCPMTAAGMPVTAGTAMSLSAVFACVRLVSSAVASTPLHVYRGIPSQERMPVPTHALERILCMRPNRYMTAATFWRYLMTSKVLTGNAFAVIMRDRNGQPFGLYPTDPRNVSVYYAWELGLDQSQGVERNRRFFFVTWPDGQYRLYDQDDILHVPNVGYDGRIGMSTVRAAAQSIGLGLAAERSSASFYENGMLSQLAFTYPTPLKDPSVVKNLVDMYMNRYAGARNHCMPFFLTEGGDVKTLSMSASDAQLIESRRFTVTDVCRFFGVPPVMIGESEKTTSFGSGVEQMARWFVTFTLRDHYTAIEQELAAKLFRNSPCFAEFDESELTRGDTKTRGEYYRLARGSMQEPGWMTINEIRAAEGLPPVPDGDELQKVSVSQAEPVPEPDEPEPEPQEEELEEETDEGS